MRHRNVEARRRDGLTNIAPHLHPKRQPGHLFPSPSAAVFPTHRNLVIAALHRLARIERRNRLAWVLLLALLCIGWLSNGLSMDHQRPTLVGAAAEPGTAASITTPAPSPALDRIASGPSESIEACDPQDDPAASFAHAFNHPGRRRQFETPPAITFTSAPPSRSERPPIRSFLQS